MRSELIREYWTVPLVMRLRYAVARWEEKCSPMTTSDPDAALVLMQGPIGRCSAVTMYLGSHFARQKARSVLLNIPAYDEHGDDAALTMQPVPRSLSKLLSLRPSMPLPI